MHTPEEIASRQFLISLRGYDRQEVETFLHEVADEVGALQTRIRQLEEKLEEAASPGAYPSASTETSGPGDITQRFEELGEETTRILVAAEESAQAIRQKAEERARQDVEQAGRQARDEVQGARRTASKIVADAERRRNDVADDVRELEEARDRLMQDLREVVKSVQGAVRGLAAAAEADAEDAGDQAATDLTDGEATGEEIRHTLMPRGVVDGEDDDEEEVVVDSGHVDPDTTTAVALDEDREDVEAMASAVASVPDTDDTDVEEALEIAENSIGVTPPAVGTAPVDEGEPVVASEAEEPTDDDVTVIDDSEPVADTVHASENGPIDLRAKSLSGIRPGMVRRLKRALQDVQNGVLDAIRRHEGRGEVDELLPGEQGLDPLGEVGRMFLLASYRAGIADGAELVGSQANEEAGDETRVTAAAATFASVLQHEITSSLAATLRAGLEAEEPETSLSERVGGVFRDLKGPVVEAVVDEHLTRVYGYGAVDIWKELDATDAKVWITGEEARCPANQCRTNEREGAVALRDEFPSGDQVPPAHDACVCAVAPK